jgi:hypothetical protein
MEDLVCLIVEELYGEHPKAIVQNLLQRTDSQARPAVLWPLLKLAVVLLIQQFIVHNDETDLVSTC